MSGGVKRVAMSHCGGGGIWVGWWICVCLVVSANTLIGRKNNDDDDDDDDAMMMP